MIPDKRSGWFRPTAGSLQPASPSWTRSHDDDDGQQSLYLPEQMSARTRFQPTAMLLWGRRGQGKTSLVSWLALAMQRRYNARGLNFQVASNYKLAFSKLSTPYLCDAASRFEPWVRRLLICIDEVAEAFPSIRASSGYSRDFASFMRQIRKRECEVIAATQFPQDVDRRLLRQIDLFGEVHYSTSCDLEIDGVRCQAHCDVRWHDYWGQWTGDTSWKPWPPDPENFDWAKTYHGIEAIWGTYDTFEAVPQAWAVNRDAILADSGWELPTAESLESTVVAEPVPEPEPVVVVPDGVDAVIAKALADAGSATLGRIVSQARRQLGASTPEVMAAIQQNGYMVEGSGSARRVVRG